MKEKKFDNKKPETNILVEQKIIKTNSQSRYEHFGFCGVFCSLFYRSMYTHRLGKKLSKRSEKGSKRYLSRMTILTPKQFVCL